MSGHSKYKPRTALGRAINTVEETAIAVLLGLMTLVTFVNVVLRYGFNESLIWGLEVVLILFAWLVLFGISYGFKITAHLGVDAVTNLFGPAGRKVFAQTTKHIVLGPHHPTHTQDILMTLERRYLIFVPGSSTDEIRARLFK